MPRFQVAMLVCVLFASRALAQSPVSISMTFSPVSPIVDIEVDDPPIWYTTTATVTAIRPVDPYEATSDPTWTLDWLHDLQIGPGESVTWESNDGTASVSIIESFPSNSDPSIDVIQAVVSFCIIEPEDVLISLHKQVSYTAGAVLFAGLAAAQFEGDVIRFAQIVSIVTPASKKGPGAVGTKIKVAAKGYSKGEVKVLFYDFATGTARAFKLENAAGTAAIAAVNSPGPGTTFHFHVVIDEVLAAGSTTVIAVRKGKTEQFRDNYKVP